MSKDDENSKNDRDKRIHELLDGAETVDLGKKDDANHFQVEEFNKRFAFVIIGGRPAIIDELWTVFGWAETPAHDRIRFLSPDAFEKLLANQIFNYNGKQWSAAKLWMQDPQRRQYLGLTFDPSLPRGGADVGGYYNLWQGFSVEPNPNASCDIFLDHIRTNVANGNPEHADFILGTLADMLQNPTRRTGIALVLRGKQGTGKTVVGQHIGKLIEGNYALVDDPRYIVGNFNAHLARLLMLQADEGFWAGDKQAEGRLKGLITSDRQMIEMKGKDPVQIRNYVHLLVTSNSDWVAPAGYEERRFAVFDVGEHCMQNHEYFAAMAAELENGGYGALLHFLLNFDTSSIDLRRIPNTCALFEQKLASLSPEDSWWFTCLQRGWIVDPDASSNPDHADASWPTEIVTERLYRSYVAHSEQTGNRHRKAQHRLGIDLRKLVSGIAHGRATIGGSRTYIYRLPSLEACRGAFEKLIKMAIDWETGEPLPMQPIDEDEA